MSFDYEAVTWGGGDTIRAEAHDFLDHSLHLRYALDALKNVSGRVIEIGCGSGRFIASVGAARPDLEIFGCDVSQTALAEAAKRPRLTVQSADALHLPYADASFDAVLMIDVLEHLDDVDAGLGEVRRILKPGAPFHLVFPCEGHPLTLYGLMPWPHALKRKHAGHVQRLNPWQLKKRLAAHGLAPRVMRSSYHLLGQLYDIAVFTALELGVDMHQKRHALVESGKTSWVSRVRKVVSEALYFEALALARVPMGMTVHVTCG